MSTNNTQMAIFIAIVKQVSLACNSTIIIVGIIGGIGNYITFTASQLRRNACVFYLLCGNTFQLLSILIPILTHVLLGYLGDDLLNQSIFLCKIRFYLVITLPELATLYMLFSIFDRCAATSVNVRFRAWSQLKIAHRLSLGILIFGLVTNIHIIVFQTIYDNKCQFFPNAVYDVFFAIYLIFLISLLPHLFMLILCSITFSNLRKMKNRVFSEQITARKSLMKRFETQLITVCYLESIDISDSIEF